jgi:hypothetical protein
METVRSAGRLLRIDEAAAIEVDDGTRSVLWGRVCEHFYISPEDLSAMLARLGARR